jgi:hypothetical protein
MTPAKACPEPSRRNAKYAKKKSEIRNPKQIQMIKNQKIPNQVLRITVLDFLGFWVYLALSLFRISIFGFRILFGGRLGAIKSF